MNRTLAALFFTATAAVHAALPPPPEQLTHQPSRNISTSLFASLEELSRIVDISYCVGVTGIYPPFTCAGRCHEFPRFELVETWNTGPLMSDSCGYIAIDHGRDGGGGEEGQQGHGRGRIVVAFRGTYSLANTIVDLASAPQEYVEYPSDPNDPADGPPVPRKNSFLRYYMPFWPLPRPLFPRRPRASGPGEKCTNCTVHTGFYTSYLHTRPIVIPHLHRLKTRYPDHDLHLVGHSLGGAVAALVALECESLGWHPTITTFGEPRFGNKALNDFVDRRFALSDDGPMDPLRRYRRVTHVGDPVPLLPLREWGYRMHAGEIYISKAALPPAVSDLSLCRGDEDPECIAGAKGDDGDRDEVALAVQAQTSTDREEEWEANRSFPNGFQLGQLFFAHRDYFWRLGLCVPGGDPLNWGRERYSSRGDELRSDEL